MSRARRPLLRAASTCWRVAPARRVALLLDNESYFAAVRSALTQAQRSVLILGWEFDPRTRLAPGPARSNRPERIGELLRALAGERAGLDIRVLIWEMALPISAGRGLYRRRATQCFKGSNVHFRFDDRHPAGACHHQKLVVIDDALAFCSGGDFAGNRWDSAAHLHDDPRRRLPSGKPHAPRHEVTVAVDGEAAAALGELARARWERASGERLTTPARRAGERWPAGITPQLTQCRVGIARTQPAHGSQPAARENEALYLAGIASARRLIYLENQYFTSPRIGEALQARLAERYGPEVVLMLPGRSPSYFDRLAMDAPRAGLIAQLHAADRHGRFHAYAPVTSRGRDIVVHAKLMIVDDRLLRAGSTNLSNRSMGLDTECDVALDAALAGSADSARMRRAIAQFLYRLAGHYVGATPPEVAHAIARKGSLAAALEALQRPRANRLRRLHAKRSRPGRSVVSRYHLGDPQGRADTFRPWRRRAAKRTAARGAKPAQGGDKP